MLQSGAGHSFAQAAFLNEVPFQPANLLIQQIVRLVDQANRDVGDHFGRAGFSSERYLPQHREPIIQPP